MSHYSVAVIIPPRIQNPEGYIEAVFAPFNENLEVAPYVSKTVEELIAEAKEKKAKAMLPENAEKEYYDNFRTAETDEELYAAALDWHDITPDNLSDRTDADGNMLTTYNPNSKWDWYEINGRWSNYGIPYKGIPIRELLNKPRDEEKYAEAKRFYEIYVDGAPATEEEKEKAKRYCWYNREYLVERYGSADNYAIEQTEFSTYAVLTPDGEWHEPGPMGWWGISLADTNMEKEHYNNYRHNFLEPYADYRLVIVDCHI